MVSVFGGGFSILVSVFWGQNIETRSKYRNQSLPYIGYRLVVVFGGVSILGWFQYFGVRILKPDQNTETNGGFRFGGGLGILRWFQYSEVVWVF